MEKTGEKQLTPVQGLLGGMSAGCFSTLGNNPFDVVKVRLVVLCGTATMLTCGANVVFSLSYSHYTCDRHECKEQRHPNIRVHLIAFNKF